MAMILLLALVATAMFALTWRFGLAVIYEMAMVMSLVVWGLQSSMTSSNGPFSALLAAFPAWQVALFCAACGLILRRGLPHPVIEHSPSATVSQLNDYKGVGNEHGSRE